MNISSFCDKMKDKDKDSTDPLDELNELEDKFTSIETEKDPLDLVEQRDAEEIPEYDSELGSIVESTIQEDDSQDDLDKSEVVEDSLLDVIDEVDVNNKDELISESKSIISELESEVNEKPEIDKKESDTESVSDKKLDKSSSKNNYSTRVVDEVKVDNEGVPLFNQFDTDKIKSLNLFSASEHDIKKIVVIIVGLGIFIFGLIQAFNDVVRISDNVIYGEHETIAIAFMVIGLLIILLSFYNELMDYFGFNDLIDDVKDDTISKKLSDNKKKNNKKN